MAKISREDLVEKLREMPKEDRTLFRDALQEVEPDSILSGEEVLQIREVLGRAKEKGKKNQKSMFDIIFGA